MVRIARSTGTGGAQGCACRLFGGTPASRGPLADSQHCTGCTPDGALDLLASFLPIAGIPTLTGALRRGFWIALLRNLGDVVRVFDKCAAFVSQLAHSSLPYFACPGARRS